MHSVPTAATARQYTQRRPAAPHAAQLLTGTRLVLLLVPVALIAVAAFVAMGIRQKSAPAATATL